MVGKLLAHLVVSDGMREVRREEFDPCHPLALQSVVKTLKESFERSSTTCRNGVDVKNGSRMNEDSPHGKAELTHRLTGVIGRLPEGTRATKCYSRGERIRSAGRSRGASSWPEPAPGNRRLTIKLSHKLTNVKHGCR